MPEDNIIDWNAFGQLVRSDFFRYGGGKGWKKGVQTWFSEPGFRITLLTRLTRFLRSQAWSRYGLYHLCLLLHSRQAVRYSVYLDPNTDIAGGLHISHPCAIVVNRRVQIGADCNLSQGVTLGAANRGPLKGNPVLGARVFIGPGAVVVGGITIGDDSAIGANSVVLADVPPSVVVAGSPAKVVSMNGSSGYVNHVSGGDRM
jgi:serine O-acetyltransferase